LLDQCFISEAKRIVEEASRNGATLRVIGATAIKMHCPKYAEAHERMDRKLTDLDFVALKSEKKEVLGVLQKLGYMMDRNAQHIMTITQRYILENPQNKLRLDVFFDKLEMCHTIDFRSRISVDSPTISLADLLLEKMQIVKINEKDIKDTLILLREHPVAEHDMESINSEYISKLLAKDWGFWYTVAQNLKKTKSFADRYETLTSEDRADIATKIAALLEGIEKAPKSMGWRMRARVGTKQRWYRDVEEVYQRETLSA